MTLKKKIEQGAREVYLAFWKNYIGGNIDEMAKLMDEDFNVIGSTEGEIFKNKKEVVKYYSDTADQISGKIEFKNRNIELIDFEQLVLVTEYSDLYIMLQKDWVFYSKVRLSSLLRETENGWKFIQQHGSIPDSKTQDGEQIGFEKVSQENLELRDAIKRRTAELEQKNRELEIEAALEKVRSRTMGMQKSDELPEVAKVIFLQIQSLGIPTWSTSYNILAEDKKSCICIPSSEGQVQASFHLPFEGEKSFVEWIYAIEKGDSFFVQELSGKDLEEHYKYLFTIPGIQKAVDPLQKAGISFPTYQINHLCFFKNGFLMFITYEKVPAAHSIFKRFTKVFEQTYTRFLDLQKAESQAREAQIEAALERVRSNSMAMHKSEDLADLSLELVKQVQALGVDTWFCAFNIYDDDPKGSLEWGSNGQGTFPKYRTPREGIFQRYYEAGQRGEPFLINKINESECPSHYNYLCSLPGVGDQLLKMKDAGIPFPTSQIDHVAYFKYGYIIFITFESVPEAHDIFTRFAKVFEQSYTRFLDLVKAEAQAREAQIETALERIRARAMAMQRPRELVEVAKLLRKEMGLLGVEELETSSIFIHDEESQMTECWYAIKDIREKNAELIPDHMIIDLKDTWVGNRMLEFFRSTDDKTSIVMKGKNRKDWINYCAERSENFDGYTGDVIPERTYHLIKFENGYLGTASPEDISQESWTLLERVTKVFALAYTRFSDLKLAEEQAREAQIELALERVRARTMAMHKSKELEEVIQIIYEQFIQLNISVEHTGFIIDYKVTDDMHIWLADHNGAPSEITIPYFDSPHWNSFIEAKRKGIDFFANHLSFDEKNKFYKDLFKFIPELSDEAKKFYLSCPGLAISTVLLENVGLYIENFSGIPYAEEENIILKRFGKVFQQTYTRFLDLQKAEAQSREAQIEAALERVRSKAMAMHSSEDLALTIDHFFHELKNLNVKPIRCGVGIKDEETRIVDVTVTSATEKGEDIKLSGKLTLGGHPILDKVYEALQSQTEYFPVLRGEEISDYYKAMNPDIEFPNFSNEDVQYGYYFHYKEGGVFAWTEKELLEEEISIFRRFKSVLSLTYRRYLDLKDAEDQAREAEIQLALERVRAKTMAMQKSNELAQTAAHLFSQLNELGIKPYRCNIAIIDRESNKCQLWSTTNHGNVIPTAASIPLDEYSVFKEIYDGWKSKKSGHFIKLNGEDRVNWTEYITKYVLFDEYKSEKIIKQTLLRENAIFSNFYFKQGFFVIHTTEELSQANTKIIQRFAHIFEQTYTRFLDLHNAEIQNKIIQAENERKTQELEEARQLQLSMLPKELPILPNLEIAVYMQTATEVGGDYYDFHVGEDGVLTAVIGDATGHGMKAGTIVTITKSLFNSLASSSNVIKTFGRISTAIKDMKFQQLSMCLSMLKIDGNKYTVSSAAMPPLYIYRKKENRVEELEMSGMPLGAIRNFPYEVLEGTLDSGDTIIMLSDGLPELSNDRSIMYGYDRVAEEFRSVGNKAPKEIVEHLKSTALKWVYGNDPDDDITFVVIKVNN